MSQDNQFHQYGYDHYLKAPSGARSRLGAAGGLGARLLEKIQDPVIAMGTLAVVGILFVSIIVITYPFGEDAQRNIPIVKADLRPIRTQPAERGGMIIPHQESTILARVGRPAIQGDKQDIENLLAQSHRGLVSKEQAIEKAMAEHPMVTAEPKLENSTEVSSVEVKSGINVLSTDITGIKASDNVRDIRIEAAEIKPDFELKEPTAMNLLQKIGSGSGEENSSEFSQKVASAAVSKKPAKPQMHAAATSPETLEFVRGILKGDNDTAEFEAVSAQNLAAIEPTLGSGRSAVDITSGSYFVQLASITDPSRASSEWVKMQASYDALSGAKFRVQRATLSHGTFYRIQAGPMSKTSANEICDALKAANKSGGCLVVK